jgi:hypothetical protein
VNQQTFTGLLFLLGLCFQHYRILLSSASIVAFSPPVCPVWHRRETSSEIFDPEDLVVDPGRPVRSDAGSLKMICQSNADREVLSDLSSTSSLSVELTFSAKSSIA